MALFDSLFDGWKTVTVFLFFGASLFMSIVTLHTQIFSGFLSVLMDAMAQKMIKKTGNHWSTLGRCFLIGVACTFPLAFAGFFFWNQNEVAGIVCLFFVSLFLYVTLSDQAFLFVYGFFEERQFVPDQFVASLRIWLGKLVHIFIAASVFYWLNTGLLVWNQYIVKQDARHELDVFQAEFYTHCAMSLKVPYEACVDSRWNESPHVAHCYDLYTIRSNATLFDQPDLVELCIRAQQWDVGARKQRVFRVYQHAMMATNPFIRNPFADYSRFLTDAMDTVEKALDERKVRMFDFATAWLIWGPILALANPQIQDTTQQVFAFAAILSICYGWTYAAAAIRSYGYWADLLLEISHLPARVL